MDIINDRLSEQRLRDEQLSENVYLDMASAITGRFITGRTGSEEVEAAIAAILDYYKIKTELHINCEEDGNLEDTLDEVFLPLGIMRRDVTLSSDWYRTAVGPMLGRDKDQRLITLIPDSLGRYFYIDTDKQKRVRINRKNASSIAGGAICFYKPLPQRELGLKDLVKYMLETLSPADYALYGGTMVAVTLINLLIPFISRYLLGSVADSGSIYMLLGTGIFMASAAVSGTLVSIAGDLIGTRIGTRQNLAVSSAMMMRVLSLPTGVFREYGAGEIAKFMDYVSSLCGSLIMSAFEILLDFVLSLAYIFQIFAFAPSLVGPALVIVAANMLLALIGTAVSVRQEEKIMAAEAKEYGLSYSLISGIKKIKIAGAEDRAFARWGRLYSKSLKYNYNPPRFIKISDSLSLIILLGGQIWMYMAALGRGISVADYYAFTSAYGMASPALLGLTSLAYMAAKIRPTLQMAAPILQTGPEHSGCAEVVRNLRGRIEAEHLSFRYDKDAPYVIDDLSFTIKSGEYVGIVGTTGCGKSTLLRLLLGFETPTTGAVYYDGKDLETLDKTSVRRRMGTVLQNGKLFVGSIFSNISITSPLMTRDQAWEAADLAGIGDDIRRMPMGMETVIPEGGGGLSGGQKQRIMIARAIAPGPRILIFDEATSALDNITQRAVSEGIASLRCTRIVVAHRLSTIRDCGRILVLDKGRIVEEGTYDELISADGIFAELVRRQQTDMEEQI